MSSIQRESRAMGLRSVLFCATAAEAGASSKLLAVGPRDANHQSTPGCTVI